MGKMPGVPVFHVLLSKEGFMRFKKENGMISISVRWVSTCIVSLVLAFASPLTASELGVSEALKAIPLVPIINTANLIEKNAALKNVLTLPVNEKEKMVDRRVAILATDGVEDKPLVVDNNLMTSRYPTDLADLLPEMARQLR